ncbi:MAG: YfcE family phosphodiesterase [Candidatus Hydrogenedentes bacterium]|nr:YfcE family phosphodiesterase [Candidatus Hydrogenedentota bacterium]
MHSRLQGTRAHAVRLSASQVCLGQCMIIGVMSDTHGNRRMMHEVADYLKTRHRAELIIHVGDDYADAAELAMAGHAVRMVPGLWCPEYGSGRVPKRIVETLGGITIAAAHAAKDLRAAELAASIVLTGHTHVATIERIGPSLHVNPGHLKSKFDRGQRPSYAIIEASDAAVTVSVHELSGDVRHRVTVNRAELA